MSKVIAFIYNLMRFCFHLTSSTLYIYKETLLRGFYGLLAIQSSFCHQNLSHSNSRSYLQVWCDWIWNITWNRTNRVIFLKKNYLFIYFLAHWKLPVGRQVVIVSQVRMCLCIREICGWIFFYMFGSSQGKDVFLHDNQIYLTHILKSLYVLGYLKFIFMELGIPNGKTRSWSFIRFARENTVFETYLHCKLFTVYLKLRCNWVFCNFIC